MMFFSDATTTTITTTTIIIIIIIIIINVIYSYYYLVYLQVRVKSMNLKFTEVKVEDNGNYTCVASNDGGSLEFTFVLEVIG